jgi:hypothetical protein
MKNILSLMLLIIIYCNPVHQKIENNLQDNLPPIRNAFSVKVSGHEDSPQHLRMKLHLTKTFSDLYKLNQATETKEHFMNGIGDSTTGVLILDLSEGKYYGKLRINDTNIYPLLMTSFSSMEIHFGYTLKKEDGDFWKANKNSPIENNLETCFAEEKGLDPNLHVYCPPIEITENKLFQMKFQIADSTEFSPKGTLLIWVGGIFVSLHTTSIAGVLVPVVMGPLGFERKIEYKQTDKINSQISKE